MNLLTILEFYPKLLNPPNILAPKHTESAETPLFTFHPYLIKSGVFISVSTYFQILHVSEVPSYSVPSQIVQGEGHIYTKSLKSRIAQASTRGP